MTSLYDERRKKIKLENHAAKKLLINNLENFKLTDLITGSGTLPGFMKGLTENPGKVITGGDLVSRTILSRGNIVRRTFRYLSFIKRAIKLLIK
ncbi:hypothetical protein [Portibacter marinus]|uniref:hypothetical protein n=1 Tax=Portibacter marinus TaxID=2898660 RepID=UPI001F478C02|nr:hypothetical protein [Portibacter marinus]